MKTRYKPLQSLTLLLSLLTFLLCLAVPLKAQETPAEITEPNAEETEGFKAPVIVDWRHVVLLARLQRPARAGTGRKRSEQDC